MLPIFQSIARFFSWYPALGIGISICIAAFYSSEGRECDIYGLRWECLALLFFQMVFFIFSLLFFYIRKKKIDKSSFLYPQFSLFFYVSLCSLICITSLSVSASLQSLKIYNGNFKNVVQEAIKMVKCTGTVVRRQPIEFYGKPFWEIEYILHGIDFDESDREKVQLYVDELRGYLIGKKIRVKSAFPSPVVCGDNFSVVGTLKIERRDDIGKDYGWKIRYTPLWESLHIFDQDNFYKIVGETNIAIQRSLEKIFYILYPTDSTIREILSSLLFGGALNKEIRSDMHRAGVNHLFAISGFHFNCVTGALAALLFSCTSRLRAFLSFIAATIFLFFVGIESASVLRAWISISVGSVSYMLFRRSSALNAYGVALGIISYTMPGATHSLAFQLSFIATLGILLFSRYFYQAIESQIGSKRTQEELEQMSLVDQIAYSFLRCAIGAISLSLSVWIFIIPYSFCYLDGLSPIGVFYNLLLPPIFTVALVGTLGSILLYPISLLAASCCALCASKSASFGLFCIDMTEGAAVFLPYHLHLILSNESLFLTTFVLIFFWGIWNHVQEKDPAVEVEKREATWQEYL